MSIIDLYHETLRDMHDMIDYYLLDLEFPPEQSAEIALATTEWLRKNWGGRTLTRIWWGMAPAPVAEPDEEELPLQGVQLDPITSERGRELRAAAWSILVTTPPFNKGGAGGICHLATQIAAVVEGEWSRTTIYIPKDTHADRAIRDQKIFRQFKWLGNIDQVIAQHGVSQARIYEIKRRLRLEKEAQEQPALF